MIRRLVFAMAFVVSIGLPSVPVATAATSVADVVISEVQTGGLDEFGVEDGRQEFVEIHNQTAGVVDVDGWVLQYYAASHEDVADPQSTPTRELAVFYGQLDASGYALFSYVDFIAEADDYFGEGSTAASGLLARTGGHLRIVDVEGQIIDIVGWGTAETPETKAVPAIAASKSAARISEALVADRLVDTDDNFLDFEIVETPTPTGGSLIEPTVVEELEPVVPNCDGLEISELMPNPSGSDAGIEYIEIYNPNEAPVYLEACVLKTSANSKEYRFDIGRVIAGKSYEALYSSVTGLTLANAAGGEILLAGSSTEYEVQYPEQMASGHSWSYVNGDWYDTTVPTPNEPNELPVPEVEAVDEEILLEVCPTGKHRNPETGRCKNVEQVAVTLAPCKVGQVRNPETNRCRSIVTVASSLVPCKAGQERNAETNRCRNVLGATTTAANCQQGYERNPETNRCRKIAVVTAVSPSVGGGQESAKKQNVSYVFLAALSALIFGYGIYEYRRDISNFVARFKAKHAK